MDQSRLIDESEDDIWEAVIIALGGYKKVSGWLWPNLKQETAYARLKNCFREDKDENLSWHDRKRILKAGREAGCHLAMHYLCNELLYDEPKPADRHRLKQEIKTQINIQVDRLEALLDRAERLEND